MKTLNEHERFLFSDQPGTHLFDYPRGTPPRPPASSPLPANRDEAPTESRDYPSESAILRRSANP